MSQLRAALLVAGADLRRRSRNRSFLVQALVGPIVLASLISLAFGSGGGIDVTIGVVDGDGSTVSSGFVRGLTAASEDGLRFRRVQSAGDARERIDDGDMGAAVVIPRGFGESLAGDEPLDLTVLTGPDTMIGGAIAEAVAEGFAARTNAARLAAATTTATGGGVPSADELAAIELPVNVRQRGSGDEVSPAAYFGPSMGLLFLFLGIGAVARSLLEERRLRVLDRMRAAPVRLGGILGGKCLSTVVMSATSLLVIWLVTAVALGADWGDPVGVVALVLAAALAIAGLAGLVAAVARTEQSADSYATVAGLVLSLVGGNFIPPGSLPPALERLSLLTPNGWALRGFAELSAGNGTAADVLPAVAVLSGWALVAGGLAAWLLPRRLGAS